MGALDKLVDLIIDGLKLLVCWVVINPYEAAVLLRLGKFVKELGNDDGLFGTGLHLCYPFIDHVIHDNVKPRSYRLGVQSLTTTDGVTVDISVIVIASIRNIRKSLLEVENVDHALADCVVGNVSAYVRSRTWAQLFGGDPSPVLVELSHARAVEYGIRLISIQLRDLTKSRVYRLHTEQTENPLHHLFEG